MRFFIQGKVNLNPVFDAKAKVRLIGRQFREKVKVNIPLFNVMNSMQNYWTSRKICGENQLFVGIDTKCKMIISHYIPILYSFAGNVVSTWKAVLLLIEFTRFNNTIPITKCT